MRKAGIKVGKASIKDIDKIAKVELGGGYHKNKKFNPLPMLKEIFQDKKEEIFIAKENNKIVGYIAIRKERHIYDLTLLAVLKRYQRKGIGRILIKHMLKSAKKNKIKKITLEVRNDNQKALSLYLQYEFIVVGIQKKKNMLKLKMRKTLNFKRD